MNALTTALTKTPLDVRQSGFKYLEPEAGHGGKVSGKKNVSKSTSAHAARGLLSARSGVQRMPIIKSREAEVTKYMPKTTSEQQLHDITKWAKPTVEGEGRRQSKCSIALVLFFTNLALVVFCIAALVSTGLQGGTDTTITVIRMLANNSMTEAVERINFSLNSAEDVIDTVIASKQLSTSNFSTVDDGLGHTLLSSLVSSFGYISCLHLTSSSGLVGIGVADPIDEPDDGVEAASGYLVYDSLASTNVVSVTPMNDCPSLDAACPLVSSSAAPLRTLVFDQTLSPWYNASVNASGIIWTDFTLFIGQRTVGLTAARAFRDFTPARSLRGVSGADIALQSLGDVLRRNVLGLEARAVEPSQTFLLLVDSEGYFLGSSKAGVVSQKTASQGCTPSCASSLGVRLCCMYLATEHPDDDIRGFARLMVGTDNTLWLYADEFFYLGGANIIQLRAFTLGSFRWVLVGSVDGSDILDQMTRSFQVIIPIISVLLIVIAVLVFLLVNRLVAHPISLMTEELLDVANLNFTAKKSSQTSRKLIELREIEAIRHDLSDLRMGLLSFNHYVPRDIVDLLLHEKREAVLGLDETEVTIMFSELRNFSDVCEGIDPESVVAHLSDYLDEMMRAVQDTSGLVDKFIGDIVMAFWNAPKRCANHRGSALRTALECQDRLVKLQRRWRGSPFAAVKAASSVHSGVCLVGNLGSPDRLSFTCIGDSVNLTSRLNGLNKVFGTAVITSGQVRDTVRDQFVTRPLDLVAVKGKSQPVVVCEVLGDVETCPSHQVEFAGLCERAFDAFTARDFETAVSLFEQLEGIRPGDVSICQLLHTARDCVVTPPPPDWNGVRKMTVK